MEGRTVSRLFALFALACALCGCASLPVPDGGSGTVVLVEGGLVETMVFGGGTTLNMQITREEVEEYDYIYLYHVLTIGRFSPVIGSGFSKRSDIYYEERIGPYGEGRFEAPGGVYRVFWQETDAIPSIDGDYARVFTVTVEQGDPQRGLDTR